MHVTEIHRLLFLRSQYDDTCFTVLCSLQIFFHSNFLGAFCYWHFKISPRPPLSVEVLARSFNAGESFQGCFRLSVKVSSINCEVEILEVGWGIGRLSRDAEGCVKAHFEASILRIAVEDHSDLPVLSLID